MGINCNELLDKIKNNNEYIEKILDKLGYIHIRDKGAYITCCNSDGDNNSAMSIWKESLRYSNYTRGHEGNVITLVMHDKKCGFPKALELIASWIGFRGNNIQIIKPFHGFYKSIAAEQRGDIPELDSYSWDDLPDPNCFSKRYIDDGVDVITQRDWGVRYSIEDDAILTPILDLNGNLIGCKARNNADVDASSRFYAYLPYQKNSVVYGAYQNYQNIISKNTILVTEAEKSVLQANAFGLNCVVAIAGHTISSVQSNIIKSLMCKNIIVAFDSGICEEEVRFEAEKLKTDNVLINNNVYYLYDRDHQYIDGKESPTDNGKKCLLGMLNNCKRRVI